jgi:hypothetical protein
MKKRCPRKSSPLSFNDRRELRNFRRFLKLWPIYGFDMIQRPRWQKYLGYKAEEITELYMTQIWPRK